MHSSSNNCFTSIYHRPQIAKFSTNINKGNNIIHSKKTSQLRTIPINTEVTSDKNVAPYDDIREVIKNSAESLAVGPCVCRVGRDHWEENCRSTDVRETCLFLGNTAVYMTDLGHARQISQEEMFELLDNAEKNGLVLQPENNKNPNFICCCCSCCCHVLTSVKNFSKPAEYFHSNYHAKVQSEDCTACENCVEICPMEALTIVDEISTVDLDRCIGCGLCVLDCTGSAMMLQIKDDKHLPPENRDDMYKKIMVERYGMTGMLKIMPKMLLGRKI